MAPERIHETPTAERLGSPETRAALKTWLADHGIKAVLFDMDDTLLDTHSHIMAKKSEFTAFLVGRVPHKTESELVEIVDRADITVFGTHSVSNDRWNGLATLVAVECGASPEVYRDGARILLSMYNESPKPFPYALETVRAFREVVPKMAVVTHANREYTSLKLAANGLDTVFDHVQVADEWGHKSSSDWEEAIRALGVEPHEALVVGDSVRGDMQAARAAGVKYLVHLPSAWEPYREGEMPQGTIEAPSIGAVVDTLLAL